MSYQKKKKEKKINLLCHAMSQDQDQGGKPFFLNANNLPGKILPWKLITLREADLNGLCPKEYFCFWQRVGLLEGERGSTYWCMPAILSLYFLSLFLTFLFSFFFSSFLSICFRVVIFSERLLLSSSFPCAR